MKLRGGICGKGGVCMVKAGMCGEWGMHGRWHVWQRRVCMAGGHT